jgi:hypothetical protein
MSRIRNAGHLNFGSGDGRGGTDEEKMRTIKELFEHFCDEGFLEIPQESAEVKHGYEFIKPSEKAKTIGKRVRKRVLSRIGLPHIGSYIERERKEKNIKPREISRRIRLSREVFREIETNRLPFFELHPVKAVDLVEILNLDPEIIIHYLGTFDLSQFTERSSTPLFRVGRNFDEDRRIELEEQAQRVNDQFKDKTRRLEVFLLDFTAELSKRGILKRKQ